MFLKRTALALALVGALGVPAQGLSFPQEDLQGICITAVPTGGTLLLGNRVLRSGDVLTAAQLEALTFSPAEADTTAVLRYLPIGSEGLAPEAELVLARRDQEPQAKDLQAETYKNLPLEGLLPVQDPEGQPMTYTLTRAPRRGEVILREDGSFLYTPKKNKVGTDSFTFTAADTAGNVSREATVTIDILKPTDELRYSDTAADHRFQAEWLRQTGIFAGETINGQFCFSPEEPVTRGQFLAMLMEVLDMPTDRSATETGFLDASPDWLKPYLAAAMRSGIITGYSAKGGVEFKPQQAVTQAEAAAMISRAVDFAIPTMATEEPAALSLPTGAEPMTRAEAAKQLYELSRLRARSGILGQLFR